MNFAVVPAAGRSSRLGRAKALVPFGTSVVIDALIETLKQGGVNRVIVIAAPGDDRLLEHCTDSGFLSAVNPRVADGMLSSIQCGLRRLSKELDTDATVTICPVDFPALRSTTVAALLSAFQTSPLRLTVPRFAGRRGHPLTLTTELARKVHGLDPARGLRALLDSEPHQVIDVDDPGIHHDLDTWLDYLELTGC